MSGGETKPLSRTRGLIDEPTECLQYFFYLYGLSYGRRPMLFLFPALAIVILLVVRIPHVKKSGMKFERMWSQAGGRLERELNYRDQHHQTQWQETSNQMIVVQKNGKNGQGGNVVTSAALEELVKLYGKFYNTSVTTKSNKTFNAFDLCSRGNQPDRPADQTTCTQFAALQQLCQQQPTNASCRVDIMFGMQLTCTRGPFLPCKVIGPLDCFQEAAKYHDAVYRDLYDPNIQNIPPLKQQWALNYSHRPSIHNKSSEQLMQIMANGCYWWTRGAVFVPELFLGGKHGNRAEALLVTFFMEAPERIKFRTKYAKPTLVASKNDIEEALTLFAEKWQQQVNYHTTDFQHLQPIAMASGALQRSTEQLETFPAEGFGLTIAGMFVLFGLLFGSCWKPLESRLCVSLVGLILVLVSLIASIGMCGWIGLEFNPTMLQVLPFLAIGLGIDDILVVLSYFDSIGLSELLSASGDQVMAAVMAKAGTSVILSSLCNTATFCTCLFLGIPGIVDFGKGGAIVMAVNLIVVLTIFPSVLLLEALRIQRRQAEPLLFCCHRQRMDRATEVVESAAKKKINGLTWQLANSVSRLPVKVSVVAVSIAAFVICLVLAINMDAGYSVEELIPDDNPLNLGYKLLFKYFGTFPSSLCVMDVQYPAQQKQILELQNHLLKGSYVMKAPGSMWLTSFYQFPPNAPLMDNVSYINPTLAPKGIMNANASVFYAHIRTWSELPTNFAQAMAPGTFLLADLTGINEFGRRNMTQPLSANNPFTYTYSSFWLAGVIKPKDFVNSIKQVRQTIANSALADTAFPDSSIFIYWEVFQTLFLQYWIALGLSLATVFGITALLLRSVSAALTATVMSAIITVEIFGINAMYLQFNVFVCVSLLLASGISVEFTVHIITAFEHQVGTVSERVAKALETTLPPVLLGSTTTLICIVPVAFAKVSFLRLYMFSTTAVVMAVGTFNAAIVLPAFLALVGRDVQQSVDLNTSANDVAPQALGKEIDHTSKGTGAHLTGEVKKSENGITLPPVCMPDLGTQQDTEYVGSSIVSLNLLNGASRGSPSDLKRQL